MIFDIYCQEVSENACVRSRVWTCACMKPVNVCMSLRGWSRTQWTLYLCADKCHRLQLLGGLCCRVGERGRQECLCSRGSGQSQKVGVGSQAIWGCGGGDNMTLLKGTSRPPNGNPGFMTQVSTCRFHLTAPPPIPLQRTAQEGWLHSTTLVRT